MKNLEGKINKIAIPVQCTILVPMEIELDFDVESAVDESDGNCSFVSIDKVPDSESIIVDIVEAAVGCPAVREALQAFSLAICAYKELNNDHTIKITPYAGLVPEQDV
jgi:hypothetical protein